MVIYEIYSMAPRMLMARFVFLKGWFSFAHKHNISTTCENTRKCKQKQKHNIHAYGLQFFFTSGGFLPRY